MFLKKTVLVFSVILIFCFSVNIFSSKTNSGDKKNKNKQLVNQELINSLPPASMQEDTYSPIADIGIYPCEFKKTGPLSLWRLYHIYGFRKIIIPGWDDTTYHNAREAGFSANNIYLNFSDYTPNYPYAINLRCALFTNIVHDNVPESVTNYWCDESYETLHLSYADLQYIENTIHSYNPDAHLLLSTGRVTAQAATYFQNYFSTYPNTIAHMACTYYRWEEHNQLNIFPTIQAWDIFNDNYSSCNWTTTFLHGNYTYEFQLGTTVTGLLQRNTKAMWLYVGDEPAWTNDVIVQFLNSACQAGYMVYHPGTIQDSKSKSKTLNSAE